MFASFTIIDSWLTSWSATDLSSLTKYFIFNVERFACMSRTCLRNVWHINHVVRDNGSLRSLMCLFNVEILCLQMNGSPRSLWRTRFFAKRINIDLLRTERFLSSCTPITSCLISGRPDLSRIGLRVGWFGWKLLDSCPASDRWAWSEPNSLFHWCFNEIFVGSRGEMFSFRTRLLQFSV